MISVLKLRINRDQTLLRMYHCSNFNVFHLQFDTWYFDLKINRGSLWWLITSHSRIFHLYGDVTIAKLRPMHNSQDLWAGRDLYHATPAVTQGLSFSGLIRRTACTTKNGRWRISSNPDLSMNRVSSLMSVNQMVLKIMSGYN